MKFDYIPLLWRKFFLYTANNRDYIFDCCNRPLNNFDRNCHEWYLNHKSDDDEIRLFDENLKK